MRAQIADTDAAAPCIATGWDRVFSPAHAAGAVEELELGSVIPTEDLKAMQRDCAGSPCLATGEARTFSPSCISCPAYALWCSPGRAEAVA